MDIVKIMLLGFIAGTLFGISIELADIKHEMVVIHAELAKK